MILVLGGTEDSRSLAAALSAAGYPVTVSVVTDYGRELAQAAGIRSVVAGTFSEESLAQFIRQQHIAAVVDATHPFATRITASAFRCCRKLGVKYIRYERRASETMAHPLLTPAADFDQALELAAQLPGPWFFTTGSKQLSRVIKSRLFPLEQLFVRVLPDPEVLASCYQLGLRAKNIVAMQGPFSCELNKAFYRHLGIKTVITKDSGAVGGVPDKIKAALDLELQVVLIKRPELGLPSQLVAGSLAEMISLLQERSDEQ